MGASETQNCALRVLQCSQCLDLYAQGWSHLQRILHRACQDRQDVKLEKASRMCCMCHESFKDVRVKRGGSHGKSVTKAAPCAFEGRHMFLREDLVQTSESCAYLDQALRFTASFIGINICKCCRHKASGTLSELFHLIQEHDVAPTRPPEHVRP